MLKQRELRRAQAFSLLRQHLAGSGDGVSLVVQQAFDLYSQLDVPLAIEPLAVPLLLGRICGNSVSQKRST